MVLTLLALAGEVAVLGLDWPVLLGACLLVGLGYSAVLTPSGPLKTFSQTARWQNCTARFSGFKACSAAP